MSTATVSTLSGERITAGHDLETQNGRRRFLCVELGIDQRSARRLLAAYAADVADAVRIGNDTHMGDDDFVAWLMRQAPGCKVRAVRQFSTEDRIRQAMKR